MRALRREFPDHPIVADLKTMDGGYLEAEMMAKAGATHVVVMARAHAETIKCVVKAGRDFGVKVMGDNMVCEDKAAASKWMEELGVDYIVHHTGFDERNGVFADTGKRLSPLDDLKPSSKRSAFPCKPWAAFQSKRRSRCRRTARRWSSSERRWRLTRIRSASPRPI